MKIIKKMTAALLCIAVTGSMAASAVFADDNGETATIVEIDAKAVVCAYPSEKEQNQYDSQGDRIRLGGSYSSGVLGKISDTTKYPIGGGDAIVYNQIDDPGRDSRVSYLRFELPYDVTESDKYTLTMISDGLDRDDRRGNMDIYAGIADMNKPVVSTNITPGNSWTTMTWTTRPVVSGVKELAKNVSIISESEVTLDLSELLLGQETGTVTIALLSKAANSNEMSDAWFKDVKLTRITTASEPEVTYEEADPITPAASEGETRDAVGFKHTFNVDPETTVRSLKWQVTWKDQTKYVDGKIPTITTDGSCIVGLLITGLPDNVYPEDISAKVAIQ